MLRRSRLHQILDGGAASSKSRHQGRRSRRQERHRRRTPRRNFARPRSAASRRQRDHHQFRINAKLGRDTPLVGDLRGRGCNVGKSMILESDHRVHSSLHDTYPKIVGGEEVLGGDGPANRRQGAAGGHPQSSRLRGAWRGRARPGRRHAAGARQRATSGGRTSPACASSSPDRSAASPYREGIVRRQVIGATVDGYIDYTAGTRCACVAPSFRSTASTTCSANPYLRPVPGRQQRGPARRHLRGGRPARRAGAARPIRSRRCARLLRKFFEFPTAIPAARQTYIPPAEATANLRSRLAAICRVTPASTARAVSCQAKA